RRRWLGRIRCRHGDLEGGRGVFGGLLRALAIVAGSDQGLRGDFVVDRLDQGVRGDFVVDRLDQGVRGDLVLSRLGGGHGRGRQSGVPTRWHSGARVRRRGGARGAGGVRGVCVVDRLDVGVRGDLVVSRLGGGHGRGRQSGVPTRWHSGARVRRRGGARGAGAGFLLGGRRCLGRAPGVGRRGGGRVPPAVEQRAADQAATRTGGLRRRLGSIGRRGLRGARAGRARWGVSGPVRGRG